MSEKNCTNVEKVRMILKEEVRMDFQNKQTHDLKQKSVQFYIKYVEIIVFHLIGSKLAVISNLFLCLEKIFFF